MSISLTRNGIGLICEKAERILIGKDKNVMYQQFEVEMIVQMINSKRTKDNFVSCELSDSRLKIEGCISDEKISENDNNAFIKIVTYSLLTEETQETEEIKVVVHNCYVIADYYAQLGSPLHYLNKITNPEPFLTPDINKIKKRPTFITPSRPHVFTTVQYENVPDVSRGEQNEYVATFQQLNFTPKKETYRNNFDTEDDEINDTIVNKKIASIIESIRKDTVDYADKKLDDPNLNANKQEIGEKLILNFDESPAYLNANMSDEKKNIFEDVERIEKFYRKGKILNVVGVVIRINKEKQLEDKRYVQNLTIQDRVSEKTIGVTIWNRNVVLNNRLLNTPVHLINFRLQEYKKLFSLNSLSTSRIRIAEDHKYSSVLSKNTKEEIKSMQRYG